MFVEEEYAEEVGEGTGRLLAGSTPEAAVASNGTQKGIQVSRNYSKIFIVFTRHDEVCEW